jgi:hypothetical protein
MSVDFALSCRFLRHPLWKLESLFISFSVIRQHAAPYSKTDSTQLLYNVIIVFLLMLLDFHIFLGYCNIA